MDPEKLERIRDFVESRRGQLPEDVAQSLYVSAAGCRLVLECRRLASSTAHDRRVGREQSPFNRLLRPEGIGAVPLEVGIARHRARLDGWDAAAA